MVVDCPPYGPPPLKYMKSAIPQLPMFDNTAVKKMSLYEKRFCGQTRGRGKLLGEKSFIHNSQ